MQFVVGELKKVDVPLQVSTSLHPSGVEEATSLPRTRRLFQEVSKLRTAVLVAFPHITGVSFTVVRSLPKDCKGTTPLDVRIRPAAEMEFKIDVCDSLR